MVSPSLKRYSIRWQGWEQWPETIRAYMFMLPAVGSIVLLFGGGLVLAVLQSLGVISILGDPHVSFAAYHAAFTHPELFSSLGLSLMLAIVATGLSTVLSIGLALLLRSAGRWASIACQITLPIPHLVGIVGILMLLSPSGFISRLMMGLGWIQSDQAFPLLVNDRHHLGILIHFVWKEIPFITLILLAVLRSINTDYEVQARALGANPWQCFWNVTLPMMKTGILSASLIVFGFVFASFEVPFLLGTTRPRTLPVLVYRAFTDTDLDKRPEAVALGLILSAVSIAIIVSYLWFTSNQERSHQEAQ
jgi:putative spermidine/putrescine transport system permease protein